MKTLFKTIEEARNVLELPEEATMEEIVQAYKHLLKKWHPDVCLGDKEKCHTMTKKINKAYEVIMAYCEHYKYSFSEKEVKKYISPEEWWLDRFGKDPLWGGKKTINPKK